MSFWGVEVKPGTPFTHSYVEAHGKLRITQATLGLGSSKEKSMLQCNVGNKRPIYLCSLLPEKLESCHLDLEFEEDDDVVLSVIGPRSVHLTGYYVGRQLRHGDGDYEPYGEELGQSDTEQSDRHSDDDDYEDSFIDDTADIADVTLSPIVNGDDPQSCKTRRLKKKYKSTKPNGDELLSPEASPKRHRSSHIVESDDEDDDEGPFSSLLKTGKVIQFQKSKSRVLGTQNKEKGHDGDHGSKSAERNETSIPPTLSVFAQPNHPSLDTGERKTAVTPKKKKEKGIPQRGTDISANMKDLCEDDGMLVDTEAVNMDRHSENVQEMEHGIMSVSAQPNNPSLDTGEQETAVEPKNEMKGKGRFQPGVDISAILKDISEEHGMQVDAEAVNLDCRAENVQEMELRIMRKDDQTLDAPKDSEDKMNDVPAEQNEVKNEEIQKDKTIEVLLDQGSVNEVKTNSMVQDIRVDWEQIKDDETEASVPIVLALVNGGRSDAKVKSKSKSKKKETVKKGKPKVDDSVGTSDVCQEDGEKLDNAEMEKVISCLTKSEKIEDPVVGSGPDPKGHDTAVEPKKKKEKSKRPKPGVSVDIKAVNGDELEKMSKLYGPGVIDESTSTGKRKRKRKTEPVSHASDRSTTLDMTSSGKLDIEDLEMGNPDGKVASAGKRVTIHYTAKLKDGDSVFESTIGGYPLKLGLGKGQIIQGLDIGLEGMREGGRRLITVPPELGYGSEGRGETVPPNAWLIYNVEMVRAR